MSIQSNEILETIYRKITAIGKDLVTTAKILSAKYGVPIVNQRISVTPIAQIAAATKATCRANSGSCGESYRRIFYRRFLRTGTKRYVAIRLIHFCVH